MLSGIRDRGAIMGSVGGALLALAFGSLPVEAGSVIVPDHFPTIQAAVDHVASSFARETVLVRSGIYPERVLLREDIVVQGIPSDTGPHLMPRIDGLELQPEDSMPFGIHCIGIHVAGPAREFATNGPVDVSFESCRFDSGYTNEPTAEATSITMNRCSLFGVTTLHANFGRVDSCVVRGPLTMIMEGFARAWGNRFENVAGTALTVRADAFDAHVAHNVVRGSGAGLAVRSDEGVAVVEDNQVEDCAGTGIVASSSYSVNLSRNRVARCGGDGIVASSVTIVRDNVVLACGGAGIVMGAALDDPGTVERNVIGRCGGDGIRVASRVEHTWTVRNNTVYACTGSGFSISQVPADLSHNIGYRNGAHGLSWSGGTAPALSCNDWFGNTAGSVNGNGPGTSDLAVDPQFCDVDGDSVTLAANSPLLDAPGCGLIGARGMGCASTPTLVTWFTAERDAEGVRVRWQLADAARWGEVRVERADVAAGPWTEVATERTTAGGLTVALDRSARAGRDYWYRLVAREGTQEIVIGDPVPVPGDVARGFELTRVTPNPGFGPLTIGFTLAREAAVELNAIDLQGRHVAALVRGSLAAGAHTVEWTGPAAAPGIYFLDYRYPGGRQVERVVRLR
jgi:hypothetical protein